MSPNLGRTRRFGRSANLQVSPCFQQLLGLFQFFGVLPELARIDPVVDVGQCAAIWARSLEQWPGKGCGDVLCKRETLLRSLIPSYRRFAPPSVGAPSFFLRRGLSEQS